MTDPEFESSLRDTKGKNVARPIVEIITFIAFVLVVSYWPSTHTGRLYLIGLGVIVLLGIWLMRKWPSV